MAEPNGGYGKKPKSVSLKNLDNTSEIICINEITYNVLSGIIEAFETTLNTTIDATYRVATPSEVISSGDFLKSNLKIAWVSGIEGFCMSDLELIITLIDNVPAIMSRARNSHVVGIADTWNVDD